MANETNLQEKAKWVRRQVLEMAAVAGEGHVSSGYSCVELLVALHYGGILRFDPKDPKWDGRDRLVLSKGHGVLALYPILADLGYFPKEELMTFCQAGSRLGVHAEWHCPGLEAVTGSLGHGLGLAASIALAAKMDGKDHRVVALLGDGECYEGQVWEAAMFAAHHRLSNLVAIVDRNRLCCSAFTEEVVKLEPLADKWRAFGWVVREIKGHDFGELFQAFQELHRGFFQAFHGPRSLSSGPLVVLADTVKGKGLSFMESQILWHGVAVMGKQLEKAREELA